VVQFEFLFDRERAVQPGEDWLRVGMRRVPLRFVRHPRARRYVLRLCADGTARVTIPRRGSYVEGKRFANRNIGWLEKQLLRQASRRVTTRDWAPGTEILFRGERVRLEVSGMAGANEVRFGGEVVRTANRGPLTSALLPADEERERVGLGDLRPVVEKHLWKLAARELPARLAELAKEHQFDVRRVSVRNQKSRWGSCSRRGTISLNWRLIQTPAFVRDYIILHELAHLKEMNHSKRFWREVARLCPDFSLAERWLKEHSDLFR
jgi:predicted metal-dependent hydrolase